MAPGEASGSPIWGAWPRYGIEEDRYGGAWGQGNLEPIPSGGGSLSLRQNPGSGF